MKIAAIIPARYDSVRLPGKPLQLIGNEPLIRRVYRAVAETELFASVIVATDNSDIAACVENAGGKFVLTSPLHQSGTDRVVEVCRTLDCDIIVNIQGDEPFINKTALSPLLSVFADKQVRIASLMKSIDDNADIYDPNSVKVTVDFDNYALYFSRSTIPYNRDNDFPVSYFKHIGVYAFRIETVLQFSALKIGKLEAIEKLEQLRWLENGYKIKMVETDYDGIGIDTPEDLKKAELLFWQK